MKYAVALVGLAWAAVVLELAQPDVLPAGAVLLPITVAGMLWHTGAAGVFAGGMILLMDWIIRPTGLPIVPVVLTLLTTFLLVSRSTDNLWTERRSRLPRVPEWSWTTGLTVTGIVLLLGPAVVTQQQAFHSVLPMLQRYGLISIPLSLVLAGLMKLAGEFGLRRSSLA